MSDERGQKLTQAQMLQNPFVDKRGVFSFKGAVEACHPEGAEAVLAKARDEITLANQGLRGRGGETGGQFSGRDVARFRDLVRNDLNPLIEGRIDGIVRLADPAKPQEVLRYEGFGLTGRNAPIAARVEFESGGEARRLVIEAAESGRELMVTDDGPRDLVDQTLAKQGLAVALGLGNNPKAVADVWDGNRGYELSWPVEPGEPNTQEEKPRLEVIHDTRKGRGSVTNIVPGGTPERWAEVKSEDLGLGNLCLTEDKLSIKSGEGRPAGTVVLSIIWALEGRVQQLGGAWVVAGYLKSGGEERSIKLALTQYRNLKMQLGGKVLVLCPDGESVIAVHDEWEAGIGGVNWSDMEAGLREAISQEVLYWAVEDKTGK